MVLGWGTWAMAHGWGFSQFRYSRHSRATGAPRGRAHTRRWTERVAHERSHLTCDMSQEPKGQGSSHSSSTSCWFVRACFSSPTFELRGVIYNVRRYDQRRRARSLGPRRLSRPMRPTLDVRESLLSRLSSVSSQTTHSQSHSLACGCAVPGAMYREPHGAKSTTLLRISQGLRAPSVQRLLRT